MSHSLEALLVGRTLVERYAVEESIGRGGMSIVYRATDTRLGRAVALKIVALPAHDSAERESLRERFRREAGSAARIAPHPNVVQVYDYGTDPELDLDFIVMELLRGRDLKAAMAAGDLDAGESLRVMREAARGVAAGHKSGIVHRDVKPGNIFLSGVDRLESVKILDFGIAKALEQGADEELTQAGQLPHSPAYASPEQLEPGRQLTPASDVYQLGAVAYELFTGARPFGEAERERMRRGETVPLAERGDWDRLHPRLREVIGRALRQEPEERYGDASEFAEALSSVPERWRSDDDATLLAQVPEGTQTFAPVGSAAKPAEERPRQPSSREPGESTRMTPPPRRSRRPTRRQLMKFAAGIGLVLLGLWGLGIIGGRGTPAVPEASALDVTAVEQEFEELYRRAHRNLQEQASPEDGDEALGAVSRVIADVQEAWVLGDLERHLSHYADRVDFYEAGRVSRSRVERERRADLERYSEREIVVDRQAITFPEPGEARALLDRTWNFTGPDERRTGSGRQELILELRDGRWLIVSERDVEVYRSSVDRL